MIIHGKRYGARGRTRTGTVLPPRDFLTRYGFRRRAPEELRVRLWGLDFTFAVAPGGAVGRSRQVSTLSREDGGRA